jgi:FkbM family methyltransferase
MNPQSSTGTNPIQATHTGEPSLGRRSFVVGGLAGVTAFLGGGVVGAAVGPKIAAARASEAEKEKATATMGSYAQFGEDIVIASLFFALGITKPSYLDIGAAEPIARNNTYYFYERGSRGVLVEPNVDLSDKTRRIRPDDKLVVAGVGVDNTPEADYYVMTIPDLNTFDKSQVKHLEDTTTQKLVRVVKMPLITINQMIEKELEGKTPDLLSIDIEGWDFAILNTLDFKKYRPKVICAETVITGTNKHNPKTPELLEANGYELRGMTYPNKIFVDKALL